jgi:hypothetical protein
LKAIKRGKAFIKSILQPYEDIPNSDGMRVLRNVVQLAEGKKVKDVVLRNITEDFWWRIIEESKKDEIRSVCAVGTPGVGKTTTTCVLIRLLLAEKAERTVVFRLRTISQSSFVYVFTTSTIDGTVDINVNVIKENKLKILDINKPNTYYVVDPGETKVNCNLDHDFDGKVIIVASPDDRHWGASEFSKERDNRRGNFLYYPVWNIHELVAVASMKHLNYKEAVFIDEQEIRRRYIRFGGVPRHIFTSSYDVAIKDQENALEKLSSNRAISLAYKDRSATMTVSNDLPKGILLSYVLSDKDNGTFTDAYAVFSSDYIYEAVATKYRDVLFTKMVNDQDFDTYLFQSFGRKLLYDYVKPAVKNLTVRKVGGCSLMLNPTWKLLGGCYGTKKVDDVIASARTEELILFTPYSNIFKLIDFGYRKKNVYYLFQTTTGMEHSSDATVICNWLVDEINATMPSMLAQHGTGGKDAIREFIQFELYYLVPKIVFNDISLQPADPASKARDLVGEKVGNNTVLYNQWNEIFSVYIAYC